MARSAKQRAALRKAQLASARKRRGKGKGKLAKSNRRYDRNRRRNMTWHALSAVAFGASVGIRYSAARRGHNRKRR